MIPPDKDPDKHIKMLFQTAVESNYKGFHLGGKAELNHVELEYVQNNGSNYFSVVAQAKIQTGNPSCPVVLQANGTIKNGTITNNCLYQIAQRSKYP